MPKFLLVAKHEYLKMTRKRSFWLGTLGIPLLIVLIIAISILISVGGGSDEPLGYVDRAGILEDVVYPEREIVEMRAFPNKTAAQAALENGEIQAFYLLPEDYLQSPRVSLYYWDDWPGDGVQGDFDAFLRANLAVGLPDEVKNRVLSGSDLTVRSADGRREASEQNIINLFLPFIAGMFFIFAAMASSGYLLQAVTDEKENRTVEILFTSLTPDQFIGGKALGLISVALSQFIVWLLAIVVGLAIGAQFLEPLQAIVVPWDFLLVMALYFVPAFSLIAGLMTVIGSMVTEMQQGQQISGMLNMLFVFPFFLTGMVFFNPNSPILIVMTLFPTTAFITVALRWGMTVIPGWQLIASWLLLVVTAGFSVWAAARVFRQGMLQYGQRINLRGVFKIIRAKG